MSILRPTEEAYTELQQAFDFYNEALFAGQLPQCLLTFQRQKKTFGYYSKNRFGRRDGAKTDEIALNPEYFAVVPMIEVLQTMVHEMTHLWQEHFGKPSRSCYHNSQWANKMESVGLMPSDTGLPGGKRVGQSIADYTIPGGRFEEVTKKLRASGFAISWLDRFPAQPPARFQNVQHQPNTSSGGEVDAFLEPLEPVSGEDQSHDGTGLVNAWLPPSALLPEFADNTKTGNRSNRSKYTCSGCLLNIWGKPGIRVMCVDCNTMLSAETAPTASENEPG